MSFDFEKFSVDHSVAIITEGYKQCSRGWIQTNCPFCPKEMCVGPHLGFNIAEDYFNCWRCGFHLHLEVIESLGGYSRDEARYVLKRYFQPGTGVKRPSTERSPTPTSITLPPGTGPMTAAHRKYLDRREYDPNMLERVWDLKGTGPTGKYKFRIIIPITHRGHLCTYQGRDITNRSELKYKAPPGEEEVRCIKDCLYGLDVVPGSDVVITEGVADVWRLGPGAVATFGIEWTNAQVKLLRPFKRRFILFDSADVQAIRQAEKLSHALGAFDRNTEIIEVHDKDPGEMSQDDADELMNELFNKNF